MECLYGFLANISRDLVCGAVNQLRYPCCFNNFVEELEKEERNLIATTKDVKDRIAHEKKQSRRTAEVVHKWDEDADKYVDDVNQLLNEARTKQNCCFGHCPDWIFRYRSGKKLAKKKTELEEFIKKGGPYVLLERAATLPSGILDSNSEKYLSFGSRQKAYEELIEAVKDDKVGMIGLYGMGGCGKTTMAMEVLKKAEAEHLFDKVLFVPVSSTVEVRRIQDKIASSLQYTFLGNEERERAERLYRRLTRENKILVILDDVWEKLDFGAIGIPSTEHHKGCKVLITTRFDNVCTSNDCQKKIQLQILTNEEAWDLFQNQEHISDGTYHTLLINLARQISDECKGLPLAIAAVASTLKGKDEVIWKVALNRLKSSKPVNIEKGLQDPYKCLELSYHYLDNEEAKSLFLLCSVFPEDYEIPIELLARCAIGLGVVGEVRSYEEARNGVIAAKIKLVSSCLLLDAGRERVKMHDLVRDVAHLITKNETKLIKCDVENEVTLEQDPIRYQWCKKLPNDLDCSNLEFLYVTTGVEVFGESFTRMRKLRVLCLVNERVPYWLPLSTRSFKTLTNLRCLMLWGWKLSDISFVRYMKNLESLSLNGCSLPSFLDLQKDDAVTQLTKLKLLVLHGCEMERNIFEVIGRIPQLEELCIVDESKEWDDYSENTIEFYKTFSVPQTLQHYTIVFGSRWYYGVRDLFTPTERTLSLRCFDISSEAITGLAKKAKALKIGNIKGGAKNIIPNIFQLEGGGIPELNQLEISHSKEIECLVDTSNHTSEVTRTLFSKLLELRISEMDDLRVLWHACLPPSGTFRKLESLYLRNCPQLTSLFTEAITPSPVRHTIFQNLQEVEVRRCGELKYVFSANTVGGLPQLKMLKIIDCDELDQIIEDIIPSVPVMICPLAQHDQRQELDEIIPQNISTPSAPLENHSSGSFSLSKLTRLELNLCPKLGSLFPVSTAKTLISLEELMIYDCHGLKHLLSCERAHNNKMLRIIDCDVPDHIVEDIIPLVPAMNYPLAQHDQRQELDEIIPENPVFTQAITPNPVRYTIFQNLQQVQVIRCRELKYVFSANTVGGLPQLKMLEIWDCNQLDQIVEDIIPSVANELEMIEENTSTPSAPLVNHSPGSFTLSKLTSLVLVSCPKLGSIFPVSIAKTLTSLEELTITNCDGLKHLLNSERAHKSQKQNSLEDDHDLRSVISMFLSLKRVDICRCASLQHIFPVCFVGGQKDFEDNSCHLQQKNIQSGRQVSLVLEKLELIDLPQMTSIWVASKNYFTLQHLKTLEITRCAKLEVIFPVSVVRCLPELERLEIRECKELKQIMKEDENDTIQRELKRCFPKLKVVIVEQCHKLKYLFSMSASSGLLNLEALIINVADELEELGNAKVELPKLKLLIFMHLPNLCQEIELLAVKHCIINNCPKLSLTSTTTLQELSANICDLDLKNIGLSRCDKKEGIGMVFNNNSIEVPPGEMGVVSNDHIVARINEEPEKEFVAKISTSEISTSLKNSELVETSSPSYLDIPLHETQSNFVQGLVNRQSMSEPCLMNEKKPLGEFINSPEISQNIKSGAEKGTISDNTNMAALSMHFESATSQSGQLVTPQSKSYQHVAEPSKPVDKGKKKMVDQPKTTPKPVGEKLMSSAINSGQREFPALSFTPPSSDSSDQKSASKTVRAIPAPKKVGESSRPTTLKELEIHQVSSTAVGGDNQEPLVEISHDSTAEVTSLRKSPTNPVSANVDILTIASDQNLKVEVRRPQPNY